MNIYDEEWVCEAHPDKPFGHDGCSGAGMLSDESCERIERREVPDLTDQQRAFRKATQSDRFSLEAAAKMYRD